MVTLTKEDILKLWTTNERVYCLDYQLIEALNVLYRYQDISNGVLVKHELGGFAIYPLIKKEFIH